MSGLILVGLGSFVGGIMRYGLNTWVHHMLDGPRFPFGTLAVNVIGCFAIGFLTGLADVRTTFRLGYAAVSFRRRAWRIYHLFGIRLGNFCAGA